MKQLEDRRWYRAENREQMADLLLKEAHRVSEQLRERMEAFRFYASMHADMQYDTLSPYSYSRSESPYRRANRLSMNAIRAVASTVHSRLTKNRPKPTFAMNGGDFEARMKVDQCNQFVDGWFEEDKIYKTTDRVLLDAEVHGIGIPYVYADLLTRRVKCERVMPWEILVSDEDGYYGAPRSILRRRHFDRLVLAEYFPRYRSQIMDAPVGDEDMRAWGDECRGKIFVTEGFHVRSGPEANDGMYAVAIEGQALDAREYTLDELPFPKIVWEEQEIGWWGDGIAKELFGIQLQINRLLRDIARGQRLIGRAHWLVHSGAAVPQQHIDNDIGSIIRWSGSVPPQVYVPQAVHPETYQLLWALWAKAFEIPGVPQMAATGMKPPGLNSGRSIREFHDIGSERHITFGHRYEEMHIQIAQLGLAMMREVAKEKGYRVRSTAKAFSLVEVDWKDIDLEEDSYIIQCFPISQLSSSPPARREEIQELLNAGLIGADEALDLLDMPDTREFARMRNAPTKLVRKILDQMMRDGEYIPPERLMNLELAKTIAVYYYLERKTEPNTPEDRLALVRQWLVDVKTFLDEQNAPPPVAPAEMGGPPPEAMANGLPQGPVGPEIPPLQTAEALPVPQGLPS